MTRERLWAAAFFLAAGTALVLGTLYRAGDSEPRPAAHFVIDTGEDLSFFGFDVPAVSPDGRHVAFTAASADGSRRLWIRPLDVPEVRGIPGTEGASVPFWSPDGRSVAFAAGGDLKKIGLAGGTAQRVCALPAPGLMGGSWLADGTIVFSAGRSSARLFTVASGGGPVTPLTTHDESRGETAHLWPRVLPDGRHLLIDVASGQEEHAGLHVAPLDAPEKRRRLLPGNVRALYASGHLLLARDGVLLAQPFDPRSLEVSGEPVPVAENVSHWPGGGDWGWFGASSGVLAYRGGGGLTRVQLQWLDREGESLETLGEPGIYRQIALSPDERRVAVEVTDAEGQYDIWVIDVARGVASRLTSEPGDDRDPVWSPDSQELVYRSDGEGDRFLYRRGLGGEPASRLAGGGGTDSGARITPESWSRDGKTLLYNTLGRNGVWALPLDGVGEAEQILELGFRLDEPQLSPDAKWLAYASEESGRWEVYVQPFRGPGERVRVSLDGGGQPKWRGDGEELFYQAADGRLMAVDLREGESGPEVGLPTSLFDIGPFDASLDMYAVSAGGRRFLVRTFPDGIVRERIHVVTNWTSLLE